MPEPQQRGIQAASATYTTAHSNARFLTHWLRPGIEATNSASLTTEPRKELPMGFLFFWLPRNFFFWRQYNYYLFKIIFYWSRVYLQYCANFCGTAKWPRHTYIYILLILSSITFHHKWLDIIPVLYSRVSLPIHSKCSSFHLLIPTSQSVPLLFPYPETFIC